MKKENFVKQVKRELDTIKKNATQTEIARLRVNTFNHRNPMLCIYGQMTGECTSKRAKEIRRKSFQNIGGDSVFSNGEGVLVFDKQNFDKGNLFTPLEKYLYMVDFSKRKDTINYLKGKTTTIDLKL